MFTEQKLEEKLQKNELKLRELTIQMEKLEREYQAVITHVGVTGEEVEKYIQTEENFSEPIWERLQNEKKKLSIKTDHALGNVKDTRALKETFSKLGSIQRHWIPVR